MNRIGYRAGLIQNKCDEDPIWSSGWKTGETLTFFAKTTASHLAVPYASASNASSYSSLLIPDAILFSLRPKTTFTRLLPPILGHPECETLHQPWEHNTYMPAKRRLYNEHKPLEK
uniref:Uncharacterized protein n=1 Tax=Moniliophthora roreri TaxID=221103 RepID=A0A0W0FXK1_MONRR